jgi:hypothetical protein
MTAAGSVVELVQITRRVVVGGGAGGGSVVGERYEYAWGFDRDIVPLELVRQQVPLTLWQSTCDRFVAQHDANQKRHETIAYRRVMAKFLDIIPVLALTYIFALHAYTAFTTERQGTFLWKAWLVTDAAVVLCSLVTWLVTRLYLNPAYLSLEDNWEAFATSLQEDFVHYGVDVRVKRIPAGLQVLEQLLPDGLLSVGLVLEPFNRQPQAVVDDREGIPATLAAAGVPAATWAHTLQQCQSLQESQAARIKSVFRAVAKPSLWLGRFMAVCFVAFPLVAWPLDLTANYQMAFNGWVLVVVIGLLSGVYGYRQHTLGLCKIRLLRQQCNDEWQALAVETEPVYAPNSIAVTVQRRDIAIPAKYKDLKAAISTFMGGETIRVVGLSFRSTAVDGAVLVSIEYGKVELEEPKGVPMMDDFEADTPLVGSGLV